MFDLLTDIEKTIERRKAEYPSVQEILHVLMDHGIDSQEWQALQDKRAAVKAKYPKGE